MKVNSNLANDDNFVNTANQPKKESCFYRSKHDRQNPYVQISREMFQDRSISPKAKGVLGYLLSLPDDWKIYHKQLMYALNIGEEYLNSAIDELIKSGYIRRHRPKIKGLFQPYQYEIAEFKIFLPDGVFRPGSSSPENPVLQKKEETNELKRVVCVDAPLVADAPPLPDHKKIKKKTFDGQIIEVSKNDLIEKCIQKRKDWTEEELDAGWEVFVKYENTIRDWFELIRGTIDNIRKMGKLKNIKEEINKKGKLCKTQMTHEEKELKRQQENSKYETSKKGTWGHHFQNAN